jgi:hypothetical protein
MTFEPGFDEGQEPTVDLESFRREGIRVRVA